MITIDPNEDAIQITSNEFANKSIIAEKRTELYHFCDLEAAKKILTQKSLLLNCLTNFEGAADYEKRGLSPNFLGRAFISCFSYKNNIPDLWIDFGDNHKGVRINFQIESALHEVALDTSKPIEAYSKNGKLIDSFGFSIATYNSPKLFLCANYPTHIVVEVSLVDVSYTNDDPQPIIILDDTRCLLLTAASRIVLKKYETEYETRLIGILRSCQRQEIEDISYLLIPLDFRNPKCNITLTYGKKVSRADKQILNQLLDKAKNNT